MTKEALRNLSARATVPVAWLAVAMLATIGHAAEPAAPPSAKQAEIDAFLNDLQRTADAPAPSPAAPAQAQPAAPVAAPPAETSVAPQAPSSLATPAAQARVETFAPQTLEYQSPLRTLLLMLGGIAVCALATVGLTLALFALRKDQRKNRRGRQRKFVPYPPRRGSRTAHN